MAKTLYCWRCKADIPMLDEYEWELVGPAMRDTIQVLKEYRRIHNATLREAKDHADYDALERYFQITGFRETNADALWHHRLLLFGRLCKTCGNRFAHREPSCARNVVPRSPRGKVTCHARVAATSQGLTHPAWTKTPQFSLLHHNLASAIHPLPSFGLGFGFVKARLARDAMHLRVPLIEGRGRSSEEERRGRSPEISVRVRSIALGRVAQMGRADAC